MESCLKLPLKKEILILVAGDILIGTIAFAGKNTLKVENVKKRFFQDDVFFDLVIADEIILDRSKILGYSYKTESSCNLNLPQNYTEIFEKDKPIKAKIICFHRRRKTKMPDQLREKVFKKFEIEEELEEVKEKEKNSPKITLELIPKDWLNDLYFYTLNKINDINFKMQKGEKSFTLFFMSIQERDNFENLYRRNFMKNVNKFIRDEKEKDPKKYKRDLIFTTFPENLSLKLLY